MNVCRECVSLDGAAHLPFATVHVPFLLNSVALFYNFGKSWKSDPGIIKASEEQKKKVCVSVRVWGGGADLHMGSREWTDI